MRVVTRALSGASGSIESGDADAHGLCTEDIIDWFREVVASGFMEARAGEEWLEFFCGRAAAKPTRPDFLQLNITKRHEQVCFWCVIVCDDFRTASNNRKGPLWVYIRAGFDKGSNDVRSFTMMLGKNMLLVEYRARLEKVQKVQVKNKYNKRRMDDVFVWAQHQLSGRYSVQCRDCFISLLNGFSYRESLPNSPPFQFDGWAGSWEYSDDLSWVKLLDPGLSSNSAGYKSTLREDAKDVLWYVLEQHQQSVVVEDAEVMSIDYTRERLEAAALWAQEALAGDHAKGWYFSIRFMVNIGDYERSKVINNDPAIDGEEWPYEYPDVLAWVQCLRVDTRTQQLEERRVLREDMRDVLWYVLKEYEVKQGIRSEGASDCSGEKRTTSEDDLC